MGKNFNHIPLTNERLLWLMCKPIKIKRKIEQPYILPREIRQKIARWVEARYNIWDILF